MMPVEREILDTLQELNAQIASIKTSATKPNLLPLFERLDGFVGQVPRDTHGQLIHYLRNKSYEKAQLWLQGLDAENLRGNCGR